MHNTSESAIVIVRAWSRVCVRYETHEFNIDIPPSDLLVLHEDNVM